MDALHAAAERFGFLDLEKVGIRGWSFGGYLAAMAVLRRPDVFPAADVGLLRAAQSAFVLAQRPTPDELAARAERWRPFRSYAAALLWAHGTEHPTTRSAT